MLGSEVLNSSLSIAEKHSEQRSGQDTTLFDSIGYWEGLGRFAVVEDPGHDAIIDH